MIKTYQIESNDATREVTPQIIIVASVSFEPVPWPFVIAVSVEQNALVYCNQTCADWLVTVLHPQQH